MRNRGSSGSDENWASLRLTLLDISTTRESAAGSQDERNCEN